MNISLADCKALVLDRLLALLWRQWCALGVPGHGPAEERRVIDPEPLLLLSLTVGRYDARLFDEILDWLVVNGAFLNVQRLKALEKRFDFQCKAQLSAVSELLANKSNNPLKWGRLSAAYSLEKPEPLFFMKNGKPLPVPDELAPEFSAHGFVRGPVNLRGNAQPFPAKGIPSLLLRLRALLGVNARCELLCLLGAAHEIHPSEIARQTGYFPRTVQNALAEMAHSGVVQVRSSNREKLYRLQSGVLDPLLKPDGNPVQWIRWAPLFRALEMLWLGVVDPKRQDMDPLLLASELRLLSREMRPLVAQAGSGSQLNDDILHHGAEYANVFMRDVELILQEYDH
jgi:hypothetical protein